MYSFYQCFLTGLKSLWLSHDNNLEVLLKHTMLSDLIGLGAARFTVSRFFISGCSSSRAQAPTGGLNGRFTLYLPAVNRRQLLCSVYPPQTGGLWQGNTVHVNRGAAVTWLVLRSLTGNSAVALRSNLSCISQSVVLRSLIRHLTSLHRGVRVCLRPSSSAVGRWVGEKKLFTFMVFEYLLTSCWCTVGEQASLSLSLCVSF